MRYLLAVLVAGVLGACSNLPPIEVCYVHPTYGQVCVSVGGTKYMRKDLTPEQKAEVERWIAEKDKANADNR